LFSCRLNPYRTAEKTPALTGKYFWGLGQRVGSVMFRLWFSTLKALGSLLLQRFGVVGTGVPNGVNLRGGARAWNDTGVPVRFRVGPDQFLFGGLADRVTQPTLAEGWLPIVEIRYLHPMSRQ